MVTGRRVILALAIIVVCGAIVAGLVIVGSPATERKRRQDDRRVRDLVAVSRAVNAHWKRHARLPSSLDDLQQSPGTAVDTRDPFTGQPYGYNVLGPRAYELCTDFQLESGDASREAFTRFWRHRAGRGCFRLDAEDAPW